VWMDRPRATPDEISDRSRTCETVVSSRRARPRPVPPAPAATTPPGHASLASLAGADRAGELGVRAAAQSIVRRPRRRARGGDQLAGGHDSMLHPTGNVTVVYAPRLASRGLRPAARRLSSARARPCWCWAEQTRGPRRADPRALLRAGTSVDAWNVTAPSRGAMARRSP
jgi:hypothetical protein